MEESSEIFRKNRLRTGVERFRSALHNRSIAKTVLCECGTENQTAEHIKADDTFYSQHHRRDRFVRLGDGHIHLAPTLLHGYFTRSLIYQKNKQYEAK